MHPTMTTWHGRNVDQFGGGLRCYLTRFGDRIISVLRILDLCLLHLHVAHFHPSHFVMAGWVTFDLLRFLKDEVDGTLAIGQITRTEGSSNHVSPGTQEKRQSQ